MNPRAVVATVETATEADATELAALQTRVAETLTGRYGKGHWSSAVTEKGVLRRIKTARVLVARSKGRIVGTLKLTTKKPWAIDPKYFTTVKRALYLLDLAVEPSAQGRGVGRVLIEEAKAVALAWPGNAIRLDAYDHDAGAGTFYLKCGFRDVGRVSYRGVPLIYFELVFGASRDR